MATLTVENLSKTYKKRQVVKDVSLSLSSGEVVGLLGPNGAGKSTSFYMIVGLVKPDCGNILLDKHSIAQLSMHERARHGIGYLPQETSVFRKLSVENNIRAVLELRKLSAEEREKKLDALLEEFHIAHLRKSLGMSLSGGERRRLEIARALAMEPRFILLDEPFAGVDPLSVMDIKQIIRHLKQKNIGVLITDHNVRETLDICERVYIVSDGKIICSGDLETILADETVKRVYLGDLYT